jgi:hypothetical protein
MHAIICTLDTCTATHCCCSHGAAHASCMP